MLMTMTSRRSAIYDGWKRSSTARKTRFVEDQGYLDLFRKYGNTKETVYRPEAIVISGYRLLSMHGRTVFREPLIHVASCMHRDCLECRRHVDEAFLSTSMPIQLMRE